MEGTCEYDGTLLERVRNLSSAEKCQSVCRGSEKCKIWIYDVTSKLCILKESDKRLCDTFVGPPSPTREECFPGIKISYFSIVSNDVNLDFSRHMTLTIFIFIHLSGF